MLVLAMLLVMSIGAIAMLGYQLWKAWGLIERKDEEIEFAWLCSDAYKNLAKEYADRLMVKKQPDVLVVDTTKVNEA